MRERRDGCCLCSSSDSSSSESSRDTLLKTRAARAELLLGLQQFEEVEGVSGFGTTVVALFNFLTLSVRGAKRRSLGGMGRVEDEVKCGGGGEAEALVLLAVPVLCVGNSC